MRSDNDPLVSKKWKRQIGRLRIEHVERGSGQTAARDGAPQGGMIDEPAARRGRLDEVVGPENWWDDFVPLEHSVICRLTIRLPLPAIRRIRPSPLWTASMVSRRSGTSG